MFSLELIVPRTLIFPGNLPAYYSFISSDLSTPRVVGQVGRLVEVLALALGAARSTEYVGILEISSSHVISLISAGRRYFIGAVAGSTVGPPIVINK